MDLRKWLSPRRVGRGLQWRSRRVLTQISHRYRHLRDLQREQVASFRSFRARPRATAFRKAILKRFDVPSPEHLTDPTQRMWAEYALSSLDRGRAALDELGGREALRGRRVLDVGCAYGGFLIAAKQAGARQVVGIDIDPELIALARVHFDDYRVKGELRVGDLLDPDLTSRLAPFDVIICNDVLEHVPDPDLAARNLGKLLKPAGRIFLEIPNGKSIDYVLSDGHYKLCGITLLDHGDAHEWFLWHLEDSYPYRTFFYAPLSYYVDIFSRHGVALRLLRTDTPSEELIDRISDAFDRLPAEIEQLRSHTAQGARALIDEIDRRARLEAGAFHEMVARYQSIGDVAEKDIVLSTLQMTYGLQSFVMEGSKLE